ncbi:MAG TPA: anti-sigma factor [Symbiobacteriaceae bacterium]|nr:anti-sigma factor [Symbiobacteriaceae bacterium]
MNCDGVRELLSAYVDGELSPGELLRVEQHLRRCPLCAEEVDALRQAIAMVGALEEVELPAGFREGLRARLAQVSPQLQPVTPVTPLRPAWHRQVKRWALPAAAAAAFALASSGVYGQLGPLLHRVADNGPYESVNIPAPDPAAPQPKDTQPAVVDKSNDLPAGTDQGLGTQTTPPTSVTPPAPSGTGTKASAPNPDQVAVTGMNVGTTKVASLVDQVTAPEKLPAQFANRTTVQAVVPDPGASCNALKSSLAGTECAIKEAGRLVEARFQVPVDQAGQALLQITTLIGEGATVKTEGIDRAPQLKAQHEQLITIEEDLAKLALAVDTAKGAAQKKIEEEALARKVDEGNKAVADYNRLSAEVTSQLFVIDLQKQGQ